MTPTTLFGLMAALAVFVLVIVLLQDRREMVTVAMTSERVPAGATITDAMVERAEVPASVRFSSDLVIPVKSWQAAGGELDVGDRVDVIDTGEGGPRYVLSGAPVVGRATSERIGGLVASQSNADLWVSVEVTAAQALDLAAVIDGNDFVLVRSTGATDEASAAPSRPAATSADGSQAPVTPGPAPTASTVVSGGG
jgi:hypothetical protein